MSYSTWAKDIESLQARGYWFAVAGKHGEPSFKVRFPSNRGTKKTRTGGGGLGPGKGTFSGVQGRCPCNSHPPFENRHNLNFSVNWKVMGDSRNKYWRDLIVQLGKALVVLKCRNERDNGKRRGHQLSLATYPPTWPSRASNSRIHKGKTRDI